VPLGGGASRLCVPQLRYPVHMSTGYGSKKSEKMKNLNFSQELWKSGEGVNSWIITALSINKTIA